MKEVPQLKPADLLLVGGDWWISDLIKFFTTYKGETPSKIHHIAGTISRSATMEALLTVERNSFYNWDEKHKYYQVWRNKNLSNEERFKVVNYVKAQAHNFYGFWKLFFHAFDGILGKIYGKDIFWARKVLTTEKYPICSWLWAFAYYYAANISFGKPPNVVSPDDIYDYIKNSDDWYLIYEKWGK